MPPQGHPVSLGATSPQPSRRYGPRMAYQPTETHRATVDSSTMHMPGPHGHLAQTYCMHKAKVLSCCPSAPLCSSKPIESPSHTHIPTYPAVHGSTDMCTDPGPILLFVRSPCQQGQLSHIVPGLLLCTCSGLMLAFNTVHVAQSAAIHTGSTVFACLGPMLTLSTVLLCACNCSPIPQYSRLQSKALYHHSA